MDTKDNTFIQKYLMKRSNVVSVLLVVFHLLIVFSPLLVVIVFPFRFYNIFVIFLFGFLMNGVINLMHECAHYHVFRNRNWNIFVGQWVLGPLFFTNFETYRERHWAHHRYIGSEQDPKDAYLVNIQGKNIFLYFLICLTGWEAIKKFLHQLKKNPETVQPQKQSSTWVLRLFAFHAGFASMLFLFAYFFHGKADTAFWVSMYVYVVIYLYSIMSVTIFIATLRAIAEHQHTTFDVIREGRASLRNFNCSFVSRIIFGSYGFGEHLTHHAYPAIPYYHLKNATAELGKREDKYVPGIDYPEVLLKIIRQKA